MAQNKKNINNGICSGGKNIPHGACDCLGNKKDCYGVCGGTFELDECGVCNGKGKSQCSDGSYECNMRDCPKTKTQTRSGEHESSNVGSERHWSNIIPEDYTIFDRSGVYYNGDNIPNDMCSNPPCVCEYEICVDENDIQTWNGGYYYPVLPKLNKFGKPDESLGLQGFNTPFGTPDRKWDGEDTSAFVTNPNFNNDYLSIDLETEELETNIFSERGGKNQIGIGIRDYKVRFNTRTVKPIKNKFINRIRLGKKKGGAF